MSFYMCFSKRIAKNRNVKFCLKAVCHKFKILKLVYHQSNTASRVQNYFTVYPGSYTVWRFYAKFKAFHLPLQFRQDSRTGLRD